jgi:HK97 family phage prohead protease
VFDASKIERRTATELRSVAPGRLEGYAAVFDSWSQDLGGFVERVAPGAFDRSIADPDRIFAAYNHDTQHILGRVGAGTLHLLSDSRGLQFEIDLPDTTIGRDLAVLVERGDVAGASFAFRVRPDGDHWDFSEKQARRTLKDVELREITITADPAYPDTSVARRRLCTPDRWRSRSLLYLETIR